MAQRATLRRPEPIGLRRPPLRRRELFAAVCVALSGLLLAACPRRSGSGNPPYRSRSGNGGNGGNGGMYRRY